MQEEHDKIIKLNEEGIYIIIIISLKILNRGNARKNKTKRQLQRRLVNHGVSIQILSGFIERQWEFFKQQSNASPVAGSGYPESSNGHWENSQRWDIQTIIGKFKLIIKHYFKVGW